MSAEPSPTPQEHIIPQGILENSIKITNEPPTGMLANLHAALDNFDQVNRMKKKLHVVLEAPPIVKSYWSKKHALLAVY